MSDPAANPTPPSDRPAVVRVVVASVAHAAMMLLAFPPFDLWWLVFLAPAALTIAAVAPLRFRWTALLLFLPMLGTWLIHQWWVGEVSAAGLVPMAAYLAAWTPLLAWVIARLARSRRFGGWPYAALVPIAWTGIEFLRAAVVLEGYPWYLLGQPLVEWLPLAQTADLGGVTMLAILPGLVGGLLADLLLHHCSPRARLVSGGAVAVILLGWIGYGMARLAADPPVEPGPTILAIQTDLPQSNKVSWTPEQQWNDAMQFARDTLAAFEKTAEDGGRIDLVAWPETMLPGVGLEPGSTIAMQDAGWWPGTRFADLALELQKLLGVPVLLGSGAYEGLRVAGKGDEGRVEWDRRFNSTYLLDDRGLEEAARYDKVHLTPFGERMPYISSWPWLEQQLLDLGARGMTFDLSSGDEAVRLELRRNDLAPVSIGTPICFEDTVPGACSTLVWQDGRKAAPVLVNASNDGWFGGSRGPRAAHLQAARFRAIENRVPLVRVVNTGTSAWIDADGRIRAVCRPLESGWLVAKTQIDPRKPLFASIGQWPSGVLSIIILLLLLSTIRDRPGTESRNP
ncbi:MAG: apolipoprotein N-acyltransferase [Phycisphaerae bacterium]|nr:apolipoprotein N-acyltransferase [Phycisphaerae bacterium]